MTLSARRICKTVTPRYGSSHEIRETGASPVEKVYALWETRSGEARDRGDRIGKRSGVRNRASPFNYDSHGAVVRGTDRFRDGHADHAQRREPEDEGGDAQAGSRGKMEPAQGFVW